MSKKRASISVALAAYNGELYIQEQMASILIQLRENDEVIISLDPSTDRTEEMIREIQKQDARVRLIHGKGKGVVSNFENAIEHCQNSIIFLSDQDDLWEADKVETVLECFEDDKIMVVMHDAKIVDQHMKCIEASFMKQRGSQTGILKNVMKNSYIGCCMAFRKELKPYILPFPANIPMHDQWIGLVGEVVGENRLFDKMLIRYRRHDNNASSDHHAGIAQMLRWRIVLIAWLLRFFIKYKLGKWRSLA